MERACKVCAAPIPAVLTPSGRPTKRQCCSYFCSMWARNSTRSARWSDQELEALLSIAGSVPLVEVVRRYNRWAARFGSQSRTHTAIRLKVHELIGSVASVGDWVDLRTVADAVGMSREQVRGWAMSHPELKARQMSGPGGRWFIYRASFKALAQARPLLFRNSDRDRLFFLLEDRGLVDRLLSVPPVHRNNGRAVRQHSTGREWPSQAVVCRRLHIPSYALSNAIRRGTALNGSEWSYV